MSKTDKEMREELAKIRKQDAEMERVKLKENTRADSRAAAADSLAKDRMMTDPNTGREISLWEYARKKADAALGADVNSYNDWRSSMMGLWNIYTALNHAMSQSVNQSFISPLENAITDYALLPAYDNLIEPLTDKIARLCSSSDDPEITFPELKHEVSFTADNKLKIAPLTRSDNVKNTGNGTLDQLFDKGVRMWLRDNGYTAVPDQNSRSFVDSQNRPLDKAAFDELKDDPEDGLGAFLKDYTDLQFSPRRP